MFNITTLLQAAEYLERREREAEHGYASTAPMPDYVSKKKIKPKKSQGNRRAHLRSSLETLKDLVPLGNDHTRHTTLGLLTNAKGFIRNLEDKEKKYNQQKDQLKREHRFLQRRLESLMEGQYRVPHERSISECSTATSSTSSTSESDEIDILGYGSGQSDTDDHSSIESGSHGYTGAAKRLVLSSSSLDSL
ncbi:MAD [Mytilus edulis]|uniref:MXD n=1 Tax=Mytilus edulis TaxID=6550 RepID=A0A8S3VJ31_MYTED|nr:MAD [Mytilus edulis]